MKKILVLFSLFILKVCIAQTDTTQKLQISVITCSPGDELYSIFGHTAIRIVDFTNQTDIIYNYGTFDFDDPNFLLKFTRGKLDYFLSTEDAGNFFNAYRAEKRNITEQTLSLSNIDKSSIQQALAQNLSGDNKFYKYDFLFDNCTTRIRDLLKKYTSISYTHPLVKNGTTFRNMLYVYLDKGGMYWSKFGIDLLLGSKIDKPVTIEQSSFLPDYLMFAIDSFNAKKYFVADRKTYESPANIVSQSILTPTVLFSFLLVMMMLLSMSKQNAVKKIFHYLSLLFVFLTGIIGSLLLFMWFCTDHKSCGYNYNLLWALPTNLIAVFFIKSKSNIIKKYFKMLAIITVLLTVMWFFLPQHLNIALLPFVLIMLLCYYKIASTKSNETITYISS